MDDADLSQAFAAISAQTFDEALFLLDRFARSTAAPETNAEYNHLMGRVYAVMGYSALAVGYLEKALTVDPRHADAAHILGQILLWTGRPREAAYHLTKALRLRTVTPDVFVFGDSHANWCFGGIPRCTVQWSAGRTMHRVGRDGLAELDLRLFGVPEGAAAVFLFGEVDVRGHILRQRDEQGRAVDAILDDLSSRYVATIQANRQRYQALTACVCSVPPPQSCRIEDDHPFPFLGTIAERVEWTRGLNARLAVLAAENGLFYLDIHQYIATPAGVMVRPYSDGVVHLRKDLSDIVEYELEKTLSSRGR
ncbi:tetratricopeptide repeat protein [Azospirillum sp. sgz301742]